MISLCEIMARHLWSVSWQVSILIGVIWFIDRLSVRASSLFRYWLWCIVLARLCIPVAIELPTGIVPSFGLGAVMKVPSPRNLPVFRTLTDTIDPTSTLPLYNEKANNPDLSVSDAHTPYIDPYRYLFFVWLAAVTIIVLALIAHVVVIRRRLRGLYADREPVPQRPRRAARPDHGVTASGTAFLPRSLDRRCARRRWDIQSAHFSPTAARR